eukprot:TRINITY_DN33403_c0_g1_i1.p1 TRINITY_DN33403_c0_g1~~TRINITY_DN33403_c0_g1_i1.p1  ORF type:complete len:359 (-),score=9.62 TRINITY_DN33403_c0_g1_i1:161-1237(-)
MVRRAENVRGPFTYRYVVYTRNDMAWFAAPPSSLILGDDVVWAPSGQSNGGLNDRHAFVPRRFVERYFGRWESILDGHAPLYTKLDENTTWITTERFLALHLHFAGVPTGRFDTVAAVRCCKPGSQHCFRLEATATLESVAAVGDGNGPCFKYPDEALDAYLSAHTLNQKGRWARTSRDRVRAISADAHLAWRSDDEQKRDLLLRIRSEWTGRWVWAGVEGEQLALKSSSRVEPALFSSATASLFSMRRGLNQTNVVFTVGVLPERCIQETSGGALKLVSSDGDACTSFYFLPLHGGAYVIHSATSGGILCEAERLLIVTSSTACISTQSSADASSARRFLLEIIPSTQLPEAGLFEV